MLIPFNNHPQYTFETERKDLDVQIFILDLIVTIFDKYFGESDSSLNIKILKDIDSPICYRQEHKIYLLVDPLAISQMAYQFSHELCHYMIRGEVCYNLRWFEECICQMASTFFFKKINK